MPTKKELQKEKARLVHEIQNIKSDYRGVLAEDMPEEIASEIKSLTQKLLEIREQVNG